MPIEVFKRKQQPSKPDVDPITKAIEYILGKYIQIFPDTDTAKKERHKTPSRLPPIKK
jgi:hypothetical protein